MPSEEGKMAKIQVPLLRVFLITLLLAVGFMSILIAPTSGSDDPDDLDDAWRVYLPLVLHRTALDGSDVPDEPGEPGEPDEPGDPDEPGEPDEPDEPDEPGEPGAPQFITDADGQPVTRIGVSGGAGAEIVLVIVKLADTPVTTYQGGIPGLSPTKPQEDRLLDVESPATKAYATYLAQQRTAFKTQLASAIPDAVVLHEFKGMVMQGMAVSLRRDEMASLRQLPGVMSVTVAREYRSLQEFSLPSIDVFALWDQLGGPGKAGKGQRIAIIDTGIDVTHPFFDDTGFSAPWGFPRGDPAFTNEKVIVARAYFTGVDNPCGAGNPITPRDFHGHGTHLAGIAAGNFNTPAPGTMAGTASGVAPRAYLMSYNVIPCEANSANEVDVIAAIEDAVADGANVINLSLANMCAGRIEDDLLVQVIENASAANVIFTIAAGNDGDAAETISSPGIAPSAITVGASTTEARPGNAIHVTDPAPVPAGLLDIFALPGTGPSLTGNLSAAYTSVGQAFGDPTACSPISGSLAGQIALIRRGDCSFDIKVDYAANAGAIAAVIYNHLPGEGPLVMPGLESTTIPSLMVANCAGLSLENWYQLHPGTAEMEIEATSSWFGRLPDAVASFSSRGPNPDWAIKPDLVAPGVDIFSSTQDDPLGGCCTDPSGFVRLSGTSFSSAHVAGAAALVRQLWPGLSVESIKSALMIVAKTPVWQHDGYAPPLARVMERGSGRINADLDTENGPVRVYPPSHSFGSHNVGNGPIALEQAFTVKQGSGGQTWDMAVVQTLGHFNLQVTVSPSTMSTLGGDPPTPDCPPPPPPQDFTFTIQVQADASVPPGEYEGFIRLTGGTQTLHVPYWIRIVNVPIPLGDVLLVDDDRDSEEWSAPPPFDCSANFISALTNLGESYTYWDTLVNGTPTKADMDRASMVIWFTCRDFSSDLNFLTTIEGTEATEMLNYLEDGGRLLLTGQDIACGSASSVIGGLGASYCQESVFQTDTPPAPSISGMFSPSAEPIAGGMQFDITVGGDGTGLPFHIDELELSGDNAEPFLFALAPSTALCQGIVGVKNSSEPILETPQAFLGRSVYLSFDFDDINNDTGFNTREELMQNILDWLEDDVSVVARCAVDGQTVDCVATPSSSVGATPVEFRWDLGDGTILTTGSSPSVVHNYSAPGTFIIQVEATDSWGHKALDDITVMVP
jgi:minor extracellular serine protease Vpr